MMRYQRSSSYQNVMRSNRYKPILVILLVLWAKVFRRNRRYGSRNGRRYRSSSYRGGRRGR